MSSKNSPMQLDLTPAALTMEECVQEAFRLAPLVRGPNKARNNPAVVARLLELHDMSGLRPRDFWSQVALNGPTMGYYRRNCHSNGTPWPELAELRGVSPIKPSTRKAPLGGTPVVVDVQADGALVVETHRTVASTDPDYNRLVRAYVKGQGTEVVRVAAQGELVVRSECFLVPKDDACYVTLLSKVRGAS